MAHGPGYKTAAVRKTWKYTGLVAFLALILLFLFGKFIQADPPATNGSGAETSSDGDLFNDNQFDRGKTVRPPDFKYPETYSARARKKKYGFLFKSWEKITGWFTPQRASASDRAPDIDPATFPHTPARGASQQSDPRQHQAVAPAWKWYGYGAPKPEGISSPAHSSLPPSDWYRSTGATVGAVPREANPRLNPDPGMMTPAAALLPPVASDDSVPEPRNDKPLATLEVPEAQQELNPLPQAPLPEPMHHLPVGNPKYTAIIPNNPAKTDFDPMIPLVPPLPDTGVKPESKPVPAPSSETIATPVQDPSIEPEILDRIKKSCTGYARHIDITRRSQRSLYFKIQLIPSANADALANRIKGIRELKGWSIEMEFDN